MQMYAALPETLLDEWIQTTHTHPAGQRVDFHYHEVDEWLEVLRGDITFSTLGGQVWPLTARRVFFIPRGEVHQVDIGAAGVEYRMYLPIPLTSDFGRRLNGDEIAILRTNLEFPIREDNDDGRAQEFFNDHLSDALAFCRANGTVVGKEAFRDFTHRDRGASGTIAVLNRSETSLLVSTVVTVDSRSPAPKRYTNIRLFVREGDGSKCRMWINFPEPLSAHAGRRAREQAKG